MSKYLKNNGTELRSHEERLKKYSCNSDFFSIINSHTKAQILGFLAADACLTAHKTYPEIKRLVIKLNSVDLDYLQWIKSELNYTGPIRLFDYTTRTGKSRTGAVLTISDSKMIKDLLNKSITHKKSLTLLFPTEEQVPREFVSSFVRGFFEGDGCISAYQKTGRKSPSFCGNLCVTKEFGEKLIKTLKEEVGIEIPLRQHKKEKERDVNAWILDFKRQPDLIKFANWIYKYSEFKMMRKYDRFQQLKSFYDEDYHRIRNKHK